MKFVGVREFKQDAVKYLNGGSEIVVMKRKKPIARLVPVREGTAEMVVLRDREGAQRSGDIGKGSLKRTRPSEAGDLFNQKKRGGWGRLRS